MKTKACLSLIICCFVTTTLSAQKKEFKFGKIDNTELLTNTCPIDTGAEAYVLGDFGTSSFAYIKNKGFQTIYQRHFRIKILKKSAVSLAKIEIPLYVPKSEKGREIISDLKGNTYNLELGKVVISKLDKKGGADEKINKDWINKTFTMPDVKEGSILEVSYTISSDFYDLRSWKFQYNIPVVYSQYEIRVPEYFKYKLFQYGFESIKKVSAIEPSTVDITWTNRKEFSMVSNEVSQTFHFHTYVTTYVGENSKAFIRGPYMGASKDYISSLEFVLVSLHVPNSEERNYESSWESITRNLLGYDDFGAIIKDKNATNGMIKASAAQTDSSTGKVKAIYEYIRDNFKWNGNDSVFASKSIRKTIEDKTGNAADINLLLVNALKNTGCKADPVVLSTRENGKMDMENPHIHKLNYVIALVKIGDRQYLLDATDKHGSFGFVPEKCLNGQGRIISDEKPGNIDLISPQHDEQNISATIKINVNGELSGTWHEILDGYTAHKIRREVPASNGGNKYVADLLKIHPDLSIQHYKVENLNSLEKSIIMEYNFSSKDFTESKGDLLMIHPLLWKQMNVNPFTLEDRKYPVDFVYPCSITCKFEFNVPEGYQVESLPKLQTSELPDKSIRYKFSADNQGDKVNVTRTFTIQKPVIDPANYTSLKELYNQMVNKETEVIVLKKL